MTNLKVRLEVESGAVALAILVEAVRFGTAQMELSSRWCVFFLCQRKEGQRGARCCQVMLD